MESYVLLILRYSRAPDQRYERRQDQLRGVHVVQLVAERAPWSPRGLAADSLSSVESTWSSWSAIVGNTEPYSSFCTTPPAGD